MVETLHPVTIKLDESTYNAARVIAENRGYFSLEEFVSDLLEAESAKVLRMTPDLEAAINEGLKDSQSGNVITAEEHKRRFDEHRAKWIEAHR